MATCSRHRARCCRHREDRVIFRDKSRTRGPCKPKVVYSRMWRARHSRTWCVRSEWWGMREDSSCWLGNRLACYSPESEKKRVAQMQSRAQKKKWARKKGKITKKRKKKIKEQAESYAFVITRLFAQRTRANFYSSLARSVCKRSDARIIEFGLSAKFGAPR